MSVCEIIRISFWCYQTRVVWLGYTGSRGWLSIGNVNYYKHISLPRLFSEGEPMEWFQKYEIYCDVNDWNDKTKAKKLPTLLEGEALAI